MPGIKITQERQSLAELLEECLPAREILVGLSSADERRLARAIQSFNLDVEDPQERLDPLQDRDLSVILMAAASGGLDRGESEDGVWTDRSGRPHLLPRTQRQPWRIRLCWAWHAARLSWRST